jgi:hypothetical protein
VVFRQVPGHNLPSEVGVSQGDKDLDALQDLSSSMPRPPCAESAPGRRP